jgi:hypothetical protein
MRRYTNSVFTARRFEIILSIENLSWQIREPGNPGVILSGLSEMSVPCSRQCATSFRNSRCGTQIFAEHYHVGMAWIIQDVRYGLRAIRREWTTSLLAIVTIALGIGANIAIFSLVNSLLLRPLAGVRAPEQLVRIDKYLPSTIVDDLGKEPVFAGACGVATPLLTTEFHGQVEPIGVLAVTGSCPNVLGVKAELGRMLTPADDREGTPKVAVLTDAFWRRAFDGRSEAVGSAIRIDGESDRRRDRPRL